MNVQEDNSLAMTQKTKGLLYSTYEEFSHSIKVVVGSLLRVFGIFLVGAYIYLSSQDPQRIVPLLYICVPTYLGFYLWKKSRVTGMPIILVFLLQQSLIYAFPLFAEEQKLLHSTNVFIRESALLVGVFLTSIIIGWKLFFQGSSSQLSRLNFNLGYNDDAYKLCRRISYALLILVILYEIAYRTGVLWLLLGGPLATFHSVIRSFFNVAGFLGALMGGLSHKPKEVLKIPYFILLCGIVLFQISDTLLSASTGLILSAALGLGLAKRRVPLLFLVLSLSFFSFLNQSKFEMREDYWKKGENSTRLQVTEMPAFYLDWFDKSTQIFFSSNSRDSKRKGQSITDRVDSLQNMTFILYATEKKQIPVLNGETYAMVPKLLVPRFIWKDKPIAHEGQVKLNLHFKRQKTIKETERTFIAWGLLPEAIGNFGKWLGPIILGLVLGLLFRWLEHVSRGKNILSVEGIVLAGVLLIFGRSYEMVASVFVTSMFQFVIAFSVSAYGLYYLLSSGQTAGQVEK